MPDIVDPATRSRMMSGIRSTDTKPELAVRSGLHRLGYRFRLHDRRLPGKPDLVFRKYKAVIFVHGCFWHMHDCHLFKWPSTRKDFWSAKLCRNADVDQLAISQLRQSGWRVLVIWECSLKGKTRLPIGQVTYEAAEWLRSDKNLMSIEGGKSEIT